METETTDTGATRYWVSGQVQGVGFRAATMNAALEHRLAGWVRNLPDGRVEVHAEGNAAARQQFGLWLEQGPPMAQVYRVEQRPAVAQGSNQFQILTRKSGD